MIGQTIGETEAREPTDRHINVCLTHELSVMDNAKQESREHELNRRFWVNAGSAIVWAVQVCDFSAQPGQVEHPVDTGQHMIVGNKITQRSGEKLHLLRTARTQHHDLLPLIADGRNESRIGGFFNSPIWHLILAAALLGLLIPAGESRARDIVLAGLAAALVASLAWAGHAVMASGGAGVARLTTQVVHLLAGALWLGGLPPLGFILARARTDRHGAWVALAHQALPHFSLAGSLAVALLFVTGCLNSWFLVGHPRALVDTPYGLVLLAKIALFLVLVAVACRNRFGLMPRLQKTAAAGGPLALLARNVAVEQGIGLLILAVVSVLGTLAPARLG